MNLNRRQLLRSLLAGFILNTQVGRLGGLFVAEKESALLTVTGLDHNYYTVGETLTVSLWSKVLDREVMRPSMLSSVRIWDEAARLDSDSIIWKNLLPFVEVGKD